jgi:hypothetical protein
MEATWSSEISVGFQRTILRYIPELNWYSGLQLGPLDTAATNRPIMPAPGDYDVGEIGGMIGKGNRSTRRKLAPVPVCPPQTPHAARKRTWSAAVGSQRLTAELRHGPYIPEDRNLHNLWCKNLKSYIRLEFTHINLIHFRQMGIQAVPSCKYMWWT